MNKQLEVWRLIHKSLVQEIPVMLLYVLHSKGSSPGRQGFFMAVNGIGEMAGSIGGGIMEHKFVEMARGKLQEARDKGQGAIGKEQETTNRVQESSIRKQVHNKTAAKNQSGMICSGEQTNFLYRMKHEDLKAVEDIINCLEENRNCLLELSPRGFSFTEDAVSKKNFEFEFQSEDNWVYREKLGYKNSLFIIGGGHCALAFSKIMSMMDFYIHLFDDRKELNTFHENNFVHQKTIVGDYSGLGELIPSGENNYVVIMTFGYRTDDVAIRALLQKEFAYFGVLGSANKIAKMFADYREEGISGSDLQKIHAPIGIPINSQTPEEIAISIAAEIVLTKNKKEKSSVEISSLHEALYSGKL